MLVMLTSLELYYKLTGGCLLSKVLTLAPLFRACSRLLTCPLLAASNSFSSYTVKGYITERHNITHNYIVSIK